MRRFFPEVSTTCWEDDIWQCQFQDLQVFFSRCTPPKQRAFFVYEGNPWNSCLSSTMTPGMLVFKRQKPNEACFLCQERSVLEDAAVNNGDSLQVWKTVWNLVRWETKRPKKRMKIMEKYLPDIPQLLAIIGTGVTSPQHTYYIIL